MKWTGQGAFVALGAAVLIVGALLVVSLVVAPSSLVSSITTASSSPTGVPTSTLGCCATSTLNTTTTSTTTSSTETTSSSAFVRAYPAYGVAVTIPVGPDPGTPLFDPQNGDIYVPNTQFGSSIDVISGASNEVIANLTTGLGASPKLAFDSSNGDVYAATEEPRGILAPISRLSVIAGATNTLIANLTILSGPLLSPPLVDSANGDIYFATHSSPAAANSTLWVVSGASNALIGNVSVEFSGSPFVDPMNGDIYLPDPANSNILVMSTATDSVISELPFLAGGSPALDTDNGDLFFPCTYLGVLASGCIAVVSGSTNTLVASMTAISSSAPVFDPSDGDVYFPQGLGTSPSGNLLAISGATGKIVADITVDGLSGAPAVLPSGYLAVPFASNGTVHIVSTYDDAVIASLAAGIAPATPVFDDDNDDMYISSNLGEGTNSMGTVTVISGGATSISNSAGGLQLTLSVNSTDIATGEGFAVAVDEANIGPSVVNTTIPNDWQTGASSWAIDGSNLSANCGLDGYPLGWAISAGTFSSDNLTAARWLDLYQAFPGGCPNFPRGAVAFSWGPLSDEASLSGSQSANCVTFVETCQPKPMYFSGDFSGYYNGSAFEKFQPGSYTVAAGDAWGTIALTHLTVTEFPHVIGVVLVSGPIPPYNPAGPVVSVTLDNIGETAISSLNATLGVPSPLSVPYSFQFNLSQTSPLLPGQTTTQEVNLIDASLGSQEYPLTISGVIFDGPQFSYTVQVQVVPPA